MRKPLSFALTAVCIAVSGAAAAQDLYLAAYGGSTETLFKEKIIPEFEKQTGARVTYVAGNSTDTLAKLQAERNNPQFDVIIVDDAPMQQAVQFGFCADFQPAPSTTTFTRWHALPTPRRWRWASSARGSSTTPNTSPRRTGRPPPPGKTSPTKNTKTSW